MAEFNAHAYSTAYRIAVASGLDHDLATEHATIAAYKSTHVTIDLGTGHTLTFPDTDDLDAYLCARAAGCNYVDAITAVLTA